MQEKKKDIKEENQQRSNAQINKSEENNSDQKKHPELDEKQHMLEAYRNKIEKTGPDL